MWGYVCIRFIDFMLKEKTYIEHLFILVSTVVGRVSIFTLAFLVGILVVITSSELGFKICLINAGIKKYKSIVS